MDFPVIHRHMHVFTEAEIQDAYNAELPIYFDTMVFRNLWLLHTNPRLSILEAMRGLHARTYLPYQMQVELHRQAYTDDVLNKIPMPGIFEPMGLAKKVRGMVLSEVENVRPQGLPGAVAESELANFEAANEKHFDAIDDWLKEVDTRLRAWLGDRIDVNGIRRGACEHALLQQVGSIFEPNHLLPPHGEDKLATWREEYHVRISQDEPVGPGKEDRHKSSLDEAAGDFYAWREMLDHCQAHGFTNGFIFVTDEKKPDLWEVRQTNKALKRIDPRIQQESISATGGPMYVLSFEEFLGLAIKDDGARELLSNISQVAEVTQATWTEEAYLELLDLLLSGGHSRQHAVIVGAARAGGYLDRQEIGEILGWGTEKRYLTRFRMPADRVKDELVSRNLLGDEAESPLWAVYDRPGEAKGYAVPDVFASIQQDLDSLE